jgi:glycosyltransferase involved in cell wall biosynthesis
MNEAHPRVAFLTDCFHEVNGVALTSRELDGFARRRGLPFFSVHVGPETRTWADGSVTTMELKRSSLSVPLDAGMHFDTLFLRHLGRVRRALQAFEPDLIHITGPGDCGLIGFILSFQLGVPLVASWHTNLHEFGARRLERIVAGILPANPMRAISRTSERGMLRLLTTFYGFARVLLAPNPELIEMLERRTKRPAFLMQRGIDTELYSPAKRDRSDSVFTIGYTGRLSTEKNVRFLAEIERALIDAGRKDYRFLVVGQGAERPWLEANLRQAEFTGVLRGEQRASAYANMDVFAFPSDTDTFGNVIMEALASGTPAVVTGGGGPKFLVKEGVTGFVGHDSETFVRRVDELLQNPARQAAMSKAAREYALGISWDNIFEKVYLAYDHTLRHALPAGARRTSIITTNASRTRR